MEPAESLASLRTRFGSVLIIDAAGAAEVLCWAAGSASAEDSGRSRDGGDGAWRAARAEGEAGVAVFEALERLGGVGEAGAFVYCRGPGSVLGIRTAAMAIRMWTAAAARPAYSYDALELLAAAGAAGVAYVADARRGEWHWRRPGVAERVTDPAARARSEGVRLATPDTFRAWAPLPDGVERVPYRPAALWPRVRDRPLLRLEPQPDAELAAEPAYVRWKPQVHART